MANILQVSGPSVNTDNRNISDSQRADYENSQRIQNPVDPSRVVRADGQEEGKSGDATGERNYSVIDYESNYGAFIKQLGEKLELPRLLDQLFSRETAALLFGGEAEVGEMVDQLISSMQMDSPEELLSFFKAQQSSQTRFSGPFFDGLRAILSQSGSESLKDAVLSFLKTYNDFSSGQHFLNQMRSITEDISHLMIRQYKDDFQQILKEIDWEAANGDTAANTSLLNGRLIPFLSNYISRTHDYGAVRDAVMQLIFHAVRYENGGMDRLQSLFEQMMGKRGAERFFKGEQPPELESILDTPGRLGEGGKFADAFSSLLAKGANGQAGLENVQQFYQILNGLLLNESVYLPLLHILVPFRYQGKDVMSEIWADPDAKKERDEARKIKMLFKFDVHGLGKFEMLIVFQDRKVDLQLGVPTALAGRSGDIQDSIAEIFEKNGLGMGRLLVKEKLGDLRIEDVFPEIREKEKTINVRI